MSSSIWDKPQIRELLKKAALNARQRQIAPVKQLAEMRIAEALIVSKADQWKRWGGLSTWASALQGGILLIALNMLAQKDSASAIDLTCLFTWLFGIGFASLAASMTSRLIMGNLENRWAIQDLCSAQIEEIVEDYVNNISALGASSGVSPSDLNLDPNWSEIVEIANRVLPKGLRIPDIHSFNELAALSIKRLINTLVVVRTHAYFVMFQILLTAASGVLLAIVILRSV